MRRVPRVRLPRRLDHGEEASLVEHLDELRSRMFVCLAALLVASIVGFVFHKHLIHWLVLELPRPLRDQLITLSPLEAFSTVLWISIYFGVVLTLPVLLWQAWSFFIPAIQTSHARMMRWFVLLATVLALGGLAFGYFVVLPAALHFLTGYDHSQFGYKPQAKQYLSFCVNILLAMALVFEMPLFILGLTTLGILPTSKLRKNRRIGYFLCTVVGLCLPGVDPVSTFFEVAPLWVLFESSIWLAVLVERRKLRAKNAPPTAA